MTSKWLSVTKEPITETLGENIARRLIFDTQLKWNCSIWNKHFTAGTPIFTDILSFFVVTDHIVLILVFRKHWKNCYIMLILIAYAAHQVKLPYTIDGSTNMILHAYQVCGRSNSKEVLHKKSNTLFGGLCNRFSVRKIYGLILNIEYHIEFLAFWFYGIISGYLCSIITA